MEKRVFDITYRAQVESGEFGLKTHDGRDARIVCWDRLGHDNDFPIIALVNTDGWEEPIIYRKDGTCAAYDKGYTLHVIVPDDFDGIEAAYLRFRETHISTVSKLACFEGGVRYAERAARGRRKEQIPVCWHQATEDEYAAGTCVILGTDGKVVFAGLPGVDFQPGEYYIPLNELKDLPKESD